MLLRMIVQGVVIAGAVHIGPAGPADLQTDGRRLTKRHKLLDRAVQLCRKLSHFGLRPVKQIGLGLPAPGVADRDARRRGRTRQHRLLQACIGRRIQELLAQEQLRSEYHGQVRVQLDQHCRIPPKPIANSTIARMVSHFGTHRWTPSGMNGERVPSMLSNSSNKRLILIELFESAGTLNFTNALSFSSKRPDCAWIARQN